MCNGFAAGSWQLAAESSQSQVGTVQETTWQEGGWSPASLVGSWLVPGDRQWVPGWCKSPAVGSLRQGWRTRPRSRSPGLHVVVGARQEKDG